MVDREPHRSVQLIRRIDTRIPANSLSQFVATSSTLGKLADLRAPACAAAPPISAPAPTSASTGTTRVSRGWNSILVSTRAGTPPPHAQGTNTSHSTTPSQAASGTSSWATPGASRSTTPLPMPSQPVAAATTAPGKNEAVPDNWEDDDV